MNDIAAILQDGLNTDKPDFRDYLYEREVLYPVGAVGDGVANDASALQDALDELKESGGVLRLRHRGRYRCDSLLDLLEDTTNADQQFWIIDLNGSRIDYSQSGLTSGSAFKAGATGVSTVHERGLLRIMNGELLGPESQSPSASSLPTADGTMVGLEISSGVDVELENVLVRGFYKGTYIHNSWPVNTRGLRTRNCYIGQHYGSTSTLGTHIGDSSEGTVCPLLIQPDATGETVQSQTWVNMRLENSQLGVVVDQLSHSGVAAATVREMNFIGNRNESIAGDLFRVGLAFDAANPHTIGAERTHFAQACTIIGGRWPAPTGSPTNYSLRASGSGAVRGWDISAGISSLDQIGGTFANSRINIMPNANGGGGITYQPIISMTDRFFLQEFAKASLPSAGTANGLIVVSDDVGGRTVAMSDGTNWRRLQDLAVIS